MAALDARNGLKGDHVSEKGLVHRRLSHRCDDDPAAAASRLGSSAVSASRPSRYCSVRWFHEQAWHTSTTKTWNSLSVIAMTGSSASLRACPADCLSSSPYT